MWNSVKLLNQIFGNNSLQALCLRCHCDSKCCPWNCRSFLHRGCYYCTLFIAHYCTLLRALLWVIILSGHRATTRVSHSNHSSSKGLMKSLQPQRPPTCVKTLTEIKEVHVVGSSANHTLQVFVCMCVLLTAALATATGAKVKVIWTGKPNTRKTREDHLWESAGPSQDCLENVTQNTEKGVIPR